MISKDKKKDEYLLFKSVNEESIFVLDDDECAKQRIKDKYENVNLLMSPNIYTHADLCADPICPLRFHITSENMLNTQRSAIEVCYYLNEKTCIPSDCIHIVCQTDDKKYGTTIIILIPPVVYGEFPTTLISVINFNLARQMVRDGIENINIDVYTRNYFMPLVNSVHHGYYVIPLSFKELLYLDASDIKKLAEKPRPEDSMIIPRKIPEAVEWFQEVNNLAEKEQTKKKKQLKLMLKDGWQAPNCLRTLLWKNISIQAGLEGCRLTSQFYAAIKASKNEIWHYIQRWARRNAYQDYLKLKSIITFGMENPMLPDCNHPLLQRFCPTEGCFMKELNIKYQNPSLFEETQKN